MISSGILKDPTQIGPHFEKINKDTSITFQNGNTEGTSIVLAVIDISDDLAAIFFEETPFHPLNYKWPDQPGDKGKIIVEGQVINVLDSVTLCLNNSKGELKNNDQIKREENSEWLTLVAHIIGRKEIENVNLIGQSAFLKVDEEYRLQLSAQHTGCHISALALNKAVSEFWKKPIEKDSLDSPDFDKNAIQDSKITPEKSIDQYRIGKSLRKKGFDQLGFWSNIQRVQTNVNENISAWLTSPASISLLSSNSTISGTRTWQCALSNNIGIARIPCGGTHLFTTAALEKIEVTIEKDSDETFSVFTTSKLK
jgi:alanyl-tRNA synthetase